MSANKQGGQGTQKGQKPIQDEEHEHDRKQGQQQQQQRDQGGQGQGRPQQDRPMGGRENR